MTTQEAKMYIFKRLMEASGNNLMCVCGIMGNIQAECDFRYTLAEKKKVEKIGMTSEEYMSAIKKGTYTREQFTTDHIGFGIVQWTWHGYKEDLWDLAKAKGTDIFDIDIQIDFLLSEINRMGWLKQLFYTKQKSVDSVAKCCKDFMLKYEKPADQSEAKQNMRIGYAERLYSEFVPLERMRKRKELTDFLNSQNKGEHL